ncbi:MAG: sigma-70 family RNA polymerase sigma factor [Chitinophagaceae bacterium]|nr:sigma-70 family RNA polymerase sigma factor [Chitinophagaceae bacterium]
MLYELLTAYLHNEDKLLERIANSDAEAFTIFFHQYRNKVYSVALKVSGAGPVAEDAVQDIFMKVWMKRADLAQVNNIGAWLNTITCNHVFTLLKRRTNKERKEITLEYLEIADPGMADTDKMVLSRETEAILKSAIKTLPPQQGKVYRLVKEYGWKREEVAMRLNLSAETVKVHLARAIKSIREYCLMHMDVVLLFVILTF